MLLLLLLLSKDFSLSEHEDEIENEEDDDDKKRKKKKKKITFKAKSTEPKVKKPYVKKVVEPGNLYIFWKDFDVILCWNNLPLNFFNSYEILYF